MKRVLMICREHPLHHNGGFAIASRNTARTIKKAGYDITFLTAEHPKKIIDSFDCSSSGSIKTLWIPNSSHSDYTSWLPAVQKFYDIIKDDYDIIHCQGYSGCEIVKHKEEGKKYIFQDHGQRLAYAQTILTERCLLNKDLQYNMGSSINFSNHLLTYFADVYCDNMQPTNEPDIIHMQRYDKVLATSTISLWDYRTRYLLTTAELFYHPIYLSEDLLSFVSQPSMKLQPDIPIIALFSGDLDNAWKVGIKNIEKLLPLKNDYKLLLIGNGKEVPEFVRNNFKYYEITGHLPEEEALKRLSEADVLFECLIHHFGLNLTGISALALGVPVIAYPVAGHYDLLYLDKENKNTIKGGIITGINDNIKEAIKTILENKSTFSTNARTIYQERFSPESAIKRIKGIYERT